MFLLCARVRRTIIRKVVIKHLFWSFEIQLNEGFHSWFTNINVNIKFQNLFILIIMEHIKCTCTHINRKEINWIKKNSARKKFFFNEIYTWEFIKSDKKYSVKIVLVVILFFYCMVVGWKRTNTTTDSHFAPQFYGYLANLLFWVITQNFSLLYLHWKITNKFIYYTY